VPSSPLWVSLQPPYLLFPLSCFVLLRCPFLEAPPLNLDCRLCSLLNHNLLIDIEIDAVAILQSSNYNIVPPCTICVFVLLRMWTKSPQKRAALKVSMQLRKKMFRLLTVDNE
jgi:hypothetical protein